MTNIAYQPLVAMCLAVACGATNDVGKNAALPDSVSASSCAAGIPGAALYQVTGEGLFVTRHDRPRTLVPTWGKVGVEVDHNGASMSRLTALLEGRSIGHVEVDDSGRAVLVVLDSLVSTSAGVSVGSSVACIASLWREVRAEADEGGVLIWRDDEARISYRLDRVLLPGNERDPVATRLNGEARVAAVLIALDSVPSGVRSRLAAPSLR